jgi:16S rRNA U516 pseudouridylate synthase RsuA-like enzyme
MDEDTVNLDIRKFLKEVGITSQREIEKLVRAGEVRGNVLKLRMTLSSETGPLNHVVEGTIRLKSN